MEQMIPLSGMDTIEFVPSEFDRESDKSPTFIIRVPTFAMRDKVQAILFQRGLIPVTVSMGRAIMVDALFDLYPEAEAEEHAAFLESYWTRAAVHDELIQGWQMREAQRIFDIGMGVRVDIPQEPIPPAPFTMREQARQARLVDQCLASSDRYRSYQARNMVAEQEEHELTTRLFLDGWRNCGDVRPERDDKDRLTMPCIEAVRTFLAQEGAGNAWQEIIDAVRAQFTLPGKLEKNSVSPLDMNSSLIGSQDSSGALASTDGSSTTSPIEPTQSGKSLATSDRSRNSRSGKSARSKAARPKSGPTDAHI